MGKFGKCENELKFFFFFTLGRGKIEFIFFPFFAREIAGKTDLRLQRQIPMRFEWKKDTLATFLE